MTSEPNHPNPFSNLQGKLLLAEPSLHESTFRKSVILLAEHTTEEGAMGLILNHPSGRHVGDLLKDPAFARLSHLPVHHGGPVSKNQLTFTALWWNSRHELRWALRISADEAIEHAAKPGRIVRAFIGYSGWEPGQLESEIGANAWIPTLPHKNLLVMDHDLSLWKKLLHHLSPLHGLLADAPDNPMLN
ncbi:YqgE/AlgH family protein [Luteolibacter pohnpeiensis]|uniref:YqgE/AlgH family protein n=1 Tax=Luteolibacter pohnpeiensis TaxID=454153 RepID=A0A934VW87_9BACT|nr:YqgE/AlgH family protein [Luteolibacter pohnpeiensis]MBK1882563.1 YqgE/AlgH family protein [Luteolibacter pohnpeiensis]